MPLEQAQSAPLQQKYWNSARNQPHCTQPFIHYLKHGGSTWEENKIGISEGRHSPKVKKHITELADSQDGAGGTKKGNCTFQGNKEILSQ